MCIHWECSQAFNNIQWLLLRSSHRRCFMNKGILKNFTGKYWASTLKILSKYMNHFMLENLSHVNIYWLSRVLFYKFLFCLNLYFYLYIYLFVKSCDFVVTVCIYGTKYSRMDQVNFLEDSLSEIWSLQIF